MRENIMMADRVKTLTPYINRKLLSEKVNKGDHEIAINALSKCVLGNALVTAYKQVNKIND
jgi:AICAR transformylase/IMP cyclohydrolase PurH